MKSLKNVCAAFACASLLIGQFGCGTTSSVLSSTQFSESALKTDKETKATAVALLARAKNSTPYTDVAADVDKLMANIDQAISSEQKRPKNGPTVAQWKEIKTQLGSTFDVWKSKGSCSPAFAEDIGSQIGGLFDILIKTENNKPKQA